jgi:hypothetical protein
VSARDSPDWIAEALAQLRSELMLFSRTAMDFSRHPARFASEWTSGSVRRLNPLGFAATSFALMASAGTMIERLWPESNAVSDSLTSDVLRWLLPFVYFLFLGVIQHGVLRVLGSQRPLRDSCAIALYAGGGPATALQLLFMAYGVLADRFGWLTGCPNRDLLWSWKCRFLGLFAVASLIAFFATMGIAQARLHRARFWKVALASVVALLGSGIFFGVVHPPGNYGMHFVLQVHRESGRWATEFDVTTNKR